ncbi:MAG: hypothetical protein KJ646_06100 [Nanoarchaeota archaeon]|nr:hypothetical protein [Nanoarchaeota archaeon]MBU4117019.1 hypothetical protein [Nanoarchaeota archaeon]
MQSQLIVNKGLLKQKYIISSLKQKRQEYAINKDTKRLGGVNYLLNGIREEIRQDGI